MTKAKNDVQVREIAVEALLVSADEARRTVEETALAELAASIREKGVIEALLVRPLGTPNGHALAKRHFEIVSGQRRWLAARRAELRTVPCLVREMTDFEAADVRMSSNLQREDLPAMEEAEAYGKLLERPGATIETVASALAKSPSYVGRRVQLLKAIEPVRRALRAGAIEVGHALELARLDEARQRQMLTRMQCGATLIEPEDVEDEAGEEGVCRFCGCTDDDACKGGCAWANEEQTICTNPDCLERFREETGQGETEWRPTHYSVAELRREVADSSHVDLARAPFPLIANLEPVPCVDCPKRAGNAQLLFDDCAQDTCTDRGCFNRKVNAWIEAELEAAKQEKRPLLRLTPFFSSDKTVVQCGTYAHARTLATPAECPHGEEGIWIDGRDAGRRALVCRKADCKTHHGGGSRPGSASSRTAQATPKEREARTKLLAQVKAEKEYRAALFNALGAVNPLKLAKAGDDVQRRLTARVAEHVLGHRDRLRDGALAAATGLDVNLLDWGNRDGLRKDLAARAVVQQMLFAAMALGAGALVVHEHDVADGAKPRKLRMEELAELVGVDWRALRESRSNPEKRLTETPAKAAKKPAKKKAAVLGAAARKRIADAQKKRRAQARKGAKGGKR